MRRTILTIACLLIVVLGLGFLVGPSLGWATPFGLPHHFTFNGRTYYDGDANVPEHFPCETRLPVPVRSTGSIAGYFTSDRQILLPRFEWLDAHPFRLFVRSKGGCLQQYVDIEHEG